MLLDAGPCKYKESSTVVKMGKKGLEILRLGAYSWAELEVLSQVQFLFVCTGNTCRSPMAEGIFRKYLAEKMQCKVEQLDKMGYKVVSAGTIGSSGFPASAEAVAVCAAKGINIGDHRNIIIRPDILSAFCAGRRGLEKAHIPGKAEDHHIEKTSPCQAENNDQDYLFHGLTAVFMSPDLGS